MATLDPLAMSGFVLALGAAHATVAVCVAVIGARVLVASRGLESTTAGPSSASTREGRARDRALTPFGWVNLGMAVLDAAIARAFASAGDEDALGASILAASIARIWVMALVVHFAVVYTRARWRWLLAWPYLVAAALTFATLTNGSTVFTWASIEQRTVLGISVPSLAVPVGGSALVSLAYTGLAAAIAWFLLFGAIRRGRHEAMALLGATTLVLGAAVDGARHLGLVHAPPAAPFADACFMNGMFVTLLVRFTDLRAQLEGRAKELNDRAKKLAQAYTELRAAQDQLVRKEQLAAVGELSAVVAHEVRNPLAIISNAVASLRRPSLSGPDQQMLLGILDEEATRLNHLVGELLHYTRPISPERQLVSVRELVARGLALTEGKIGLDVDLFEPEPTPRIWADPNLLRQVFDNLIDNAIQAMSSGGVLSVGIANLVQDGAPGVEVQIRDTGEGMDTDVRARALDPFFTTRPSGTGLGLAIVARIVDAHGGTVRIRSKAGAGTAIHVFLPTSAEQGPRPRGDDTGRRSEPVLPPELAKSLSRDP